MNLKQCCLSCLDNGLCNWNSTKYAIYLLKFVARCLTCVQVSYQNKNLAYFANIKAFSTCHCLNSLVRGVHLIEVYFYRSDGS